MPWCPATSMFPQNGLHCEVWVGNHCWIWSYLFQPGDGWKKSISFSPGGWSIGTDSCVMRPLLSIPKLMASDGWREMTENLVSGSCFPNVLPKLEKSASKKLLLIKKKNPHWRKNFLWVLNSLGEVKKKSKQIDLYPFTSCVPSNKYQYRCR